MQKTTEVTIHDKKLASQVEKKRVALVSLEKRNYYDSGFFTMFQSYIIKLSKSGLSGREWNVLAQLLARLDYANNVIVSHSEIAAELETQRQNVSKAFHALEEAGCITKTVINGINTYRLNANFVWRGSSKSWTKAKAGQKQTDAEREEKKRISNLAKRAAEKIKAGGDYDEAIESVVNENSAPPEELFHEYMLVGEALKKLGIIKPEEEYAEE